MTAVVAAVRRGGYDCYEASLVLGDALVTRGFQVDFDHRYIPAAQWNDATEDDFEVIDTLRHVAKDLRNSAQTS